MASVVLSAAIVQNSVGGEVTTHIVATAAPPLHL